MLTEDTFGNQRSNRHDAVGYNDHHDVAAGAAATTSTTTTTTDTATPLPPVV